MEITGTIKSILEPRKAADRHTMIHEFVITHRADDSRNLPLQHSIFQINEAMPGQLAVKQLSEVKEGDEVKVLFNIRGREWISPHRGNIPVYFNSLHAFNIQKLNGSNTAGLR